MIFHEFEEYKYKSIRITPQIIVEIIFYLYKNDSSKYERKDVVQKVVNFHRKNEGDETESNNLTQVKRALQSINSSYIKNITVGYWQFMFDDNTDYDNFYQPKKIPKNLTSQLPQIKESNINIKNGWVYFYFYPSYKELSILKNEKYFPIKIGKSQNQPKFRISEQVGTAIPEKPVVFLEVKTKDCSNLERNLHSTLALMERKEAESVGKEWFLSNEHELVDLINRLISLGIELETDLKE